MSLEIVSRFCPFCFQQDKNSNLETNVQVNSNVVIKENCKIGIMDDNICARFEAMLNG